jgi:hypothetical protein
MQENCAEHLEHFGDNWAECLWLEEGTQYIWSAAEKVTACRIARVFPHFVSGRKTRVGANITRWIGLLVGLSIGRWCHSQHYAGEAWR